MTINKLLHQIFLKRKGGKTSAKIVDLLLVRPFFKDGHYDDSQILIDKSQDGLKWGKLLYNQIKEWR